MNRLIAATLLSGALSASAGLAVAQGQHEREPRPFSRPTERVEARLAYIRSALKITDAQQPQWNAFADGMRQRAAEREKRMHEWREKMAQDKGKHEHRRPSVIERLDFSEKMHAEAIARLNAQLALLKPLYESLSAEQKKVADVVLAPRQRRGGFGRGHGEGHRMPWGRA
jgi:hypothetical protein